MNCSRCDASEMRQFEKFFKRSVTFAENTNPIGEQVSTACDAVRRSTRPS